MHRLIVNDVMNDDVSDWGSDFDEEIEDGNHNHNMVQPQQQHYGDLYEVPDGKPVIEMIPTPPTALVPEWLRKVEGLHHHHQPQHSSQLIDENVKPQQTVYIEHVLLPTRTTKDEESKNFIETLKRKLSQKNLLVAVASAAAAANKKMIGGISSGVVGDPKICSQQVLSKTERELVKNVKESLYKVPWFYRVDRNKAELILENYSADGSFMVRECHHGGPKVPFTLTMRFHQRLFHIQIRIRPEDSHFALGTFKKNEMHFSTVQEMIDTYRKTPLQLHSNGKFFGETILTHPPIVYSYTNI